jgi:hypothetical protein
MHEIEIHYFAHLLQAQLQASKDMYTLALRHAFYKGARFQCRVTPRVPLWLTDSRPL